MESLKWAKVRNVFFGVFLGFYASASFAFDKPVIDPSESFLDDNVAEPSSAPADAPFGPQNLWLLQSGALNRLGVDEFAVLERHPARNADALALQASNGAVWFADNAGLHAIDLDGNALLPEPVPLPDDEKVSGLAVDDANGQLWIATESGLHRLSIAGQYLGFLPLENISRPLAWMRDRGDLWVLAEGRVNRINASGEPLGSITVPGLTDPQAMAEMQDGNGAWIAGSDNVAGLRSDGSRVAGPWQHGLTNLLFIAGDGAGGTWLANRKNIVHLDGSGRVTVDLPAARSPGDGAIRALAADSRDGSAWVAVNHAAYKLTTDGDITGAVALEKNGGAVMAAALHIDDTRPEIWITTPDPESRTNDTTPPISVSYADHGSRVVPGSLDFTLNERDVSIRCDAGETAAECVPEAPLREGSQTLAAVIKDLADNESEPSSVRFIVDTTAPSITLESPANGALVNQDSLPFTGFLDEPGMLELDGTSVALDEENRFSGNLALASEGANDFLFTASDLAGNQAQLGISVTRDTIPPIPVMADSVEVEYLSEGIRVTGRPGSAEPGSSIRITNTATGESLVVAVNADGGFTATFSGNSVGGSLILQSRDAAGNLGEAVEVALQSAPAAVALERGDFGYAYRSLVPADATLEQYAPERFSLLSGRVTNLQGEPVPGVAVSVLNHPEYGTVTTNEAGRFTLPVEGGGNLVVNYEKAGFTFVQRKVETEWNRIQAIEDVMLLQQDAVATTVDFDGNPDTRIVHRSSEYAGPDGARATTLVFRGDTTVTVRAPDGSTAPLEGPLTVRATEFVLPGTMPGALPSTSAFTFASDLAVDGVSPFSEVRFSKPVIMYVENFLEFPVGEVVPLGYYDRNRAEWIAADDGKVVRLLDANGDGAVDSLDATGDGRRDDLNGNGSYADEVAGIMGHSEYVAGASYWRTPITHFTPWDANWPYDYPDDAVDPPAEPPIQDNADDCEASASVGSSVSCESRIFSETIALVGSDHSLRYQSNRTAGYKSVIEIPVTGSEVPATLRHAELRVQIAGQVFEYELPPEPDQSVTVEWDGRDHLGHLMSGDVTAHVTIKYQYPLFYVAGSGGSNGRSFARRGARIIAFRGNPDLGAALVRDYEIPINTGRGTDSGFGAGWSLASVHQFDARSNRVYKGDGSIIENRILGKLDVLVGRNVPQDHPGYAPVSPYDVHVDDAGRVVFSVAHRIMAFDRNGDLHTLVGTLDNSRSPGENDGAPADSVPVARIMAFDIGPDGTLYFLETLCWGCSTSAIRHVKADGTLETIARYSGDATDIAVDGDGNVFVTLEAADQLWRIAPDGSQEMYARERYWPWGVDVDDHGNVYFNATYGHRVHVLKPDGSKDSIQLGYPQEVDWDGNGNMYATSVYKSSWSGNGVYFKPAGGSLRRISGSNNAPPPAIGKRLSEVRFAARHIEYSESLGGLLIADGSNVWIARTRPEVPGLSGGERVVTDGEAGLGYVFAKDGRHLRTFDLVSQVVVQTNEYDEQGRLAGIVDRFDNRTVIERNADGRATAIVGPQGQRNELLVNASGELERITYPDGESYGFGYNEQQLLTHKLVPASDRYEYFYNERGRVERTRDPLNAEHRFSVQRVAGVGLVSTTTDPEGRVRTSVRSADAEGNLHWKRTAEDGSVSTLDLTQDGTGSSSEAADGTRVIVQRGHDDALETVFTKRVTTRLPSGLENHLSVLPVTDDHDGDGRWDLRRETTTINGRTQVLEDDLVAGERRFTSAAGRVRITEYDPSTLLAESTRLAGLASVQYGWTPQGQLQQLLASAGEGSARVTTFDYYASGPSNGRLRTVTDALDRSVHFEYDLNGRITSQTLPGNRTVTYDYDANGNLTALAPPGRPAHRFTHTVVGLEESYTPPDLGDGIEATHYAWNLDKQLELITRPDGKQIDYVHDASTGKLDAIDVPRGRYAYGYDPVTGQLATLTAPDGTTLSYTYDGFLPTGSGLSGDLNGEVTYDYDSNFWLKGIAVNGQRTAYGYDEDGLLTQAGALNLDRDAGNGLLQATRIGVVATDPGYNAFGELDDRAVTVNGAEVYTVDYERDKLRRITKKTETVNGKTVAHGYIYDLAGRLDVVTRDGSVIADYTYDSNGNRTHVNGAKVGEYDMQDRLLSYGGCNYAYTANGELDTRTCGTETLDVDYDVFGNLHHAELPDGRQIDYLTDGQNRRIGKKINGDLVQGFLYQDQLNPVAELDGAGNVVSRFIYAEKANVPAYMVKAGTTYRIISDHLGSPRLVIDTATGEIIQRMDYDAWGNVIEDTNSGFQPFGFAGGIYDRDTGLVRFGARDYDPETGRWTAKDPIGFAGGLNVYQYVSNDPVNRIDPKGLVDYNFSAGFHLPISPGVAVGPAVSSTYRDGNGQSNGVSAEVAIGVIADIGAAASVSDLDGNGSSDGAPYTINFGLGPRAGVQIRPRSSQNDCLSIFNPARYIDEISFGIGVGIATPVSVSGPVQ